MSDDLVDQAKAVHDMALAMQRAVGFEPSEASIAQVKQWIWRSVNQGYSPVLLPEKPIELSANWEKTA